MYVRPLTVLSRGLKATYPLCLAKADNVSEKSVSGEIKLRWEGKRHFTVDDVSLVIYKGKERKQVRFKSLMPALVVSMTASLKRSNALEESNLVCSTSSDVVSFWERDA